MSYNPASRFHSIPKITCQLRGEGQPEARDRERRLCDSGTSYLVEPAGLQFSMEVLSDADGRFGLEINLGKSKWVNIGPVDKKCFLLQLANYLYMFLGNWGVAS